ncbi:UTP--glucose-1-phosphate uridylyltransferase [invertebrate metagenome]|uniref:UTP--glucose-1-phosphate uridylyltransferase n=1 Tax=invertebrate metagenome TaxID=1711999 RepID=A0A2H9T688_9ZZZZ
MKAMILAAGLGKRLRPLTLQTPKPLLPVAGKPLIVYHIEKLATSGIQDIVINISWLGHKIREYLGDGSRWHIRLHYSHETEPLETGGGILKALPLLGNGPFIVINSDIYSSFSPETLSLPAGKLAHLVMVSNPAFHEQGDFLLSHGVLSNPFNRTNRKPDNNQRLTFSGISMLTPELFKNCKAGAFPLAPLLTDAMTSKKISGHYFPGYWIDAGTSDRMQSLDNYLSQLRLNGNS